MIYEVTYIQNEKEYTSRVSLAYLTRMENNPDVEIISVD